MEAIQRLLGRRYLDRVYAETYQAAAFAEEARCLGHSVELIHPGQRVQADIFTHMSEVVSQGRLFIPAEFEVLFEEFNIQ